MGNRNIIDNVLLGSVLDANIPIAKRDFLIFKNLGCIVSSVHDVDFGEAADGALASWIDFAHEFEGLAGGQILVGGDDAEDD